MFSSQFIEHFHFLRPAWALLLVPVLYIVYQQRKQRDETRGWQSIIAPHLLEALRVRQYRSTWFKRIDSSANTASITADGADLIDGASTTALLQYESIVLLSDLSNWHAF